MTVRRPFPGAPRRATLGAVLLGGLIAVPMAPLPSLAAPPAQIEGLETLLRGENVRVRLDPGDDAEEIAILQDGEPVEVTGAGTDIDGHVWWPILVIATGDEGWVRWEFLVSGTPVLAAPPADVAVDAGTADDGGGQNRQRNRNRDANADAAAAAAEEDGQNNRRRNRERNNAAADETAAPTDVPAEAASALPFAASGDAGIIDAGGFESPGGRLTYVATHEGDGPFIVSLVDADGAEEIVIEADGAYDDQVRFRTAEGAYSILVDASGPWTIEVQAPS